MKTKITTNTKHRIDIIQKECKVFSERNYTHISIFKNGDYISLFITDDDQISIEASIHDNVNKYPELKNKTNSINPENSASFKTKTSTLKASNIDLKLTRFIN
jgi:hypothetical protein